MLQDALGRCPGDIGRTRTSLFASSLGHLLEFVVESRRSTPHQEVILRPSDADLRICNVAPPLLQVTFMRLRMVLTNIFGVDATDKSPFVDNAIQFPVGAPVVECIEYLTTSREECPGVPCPILILAIVAVPP